jgi:hypothetical protein
VLILDEVHTLLRQVQQHLEEFNASTSPKAEFEYWDRVSAAREAFRENIRAGVSGDEGGLKLDEVDRILGAFEIKVSQGIKRALEMNQGFPPTYFKYEIDQYELMKDENGEITHNKMGHPFIRAKQFSPKTLPVFLEGAVRFIKILNDLNTKRSIYKKVKASELFDTKLSMYKVNTSLADQPHDIGRAKAFPPGWLENESIWLHMEYKYLLEILKAGLWDEFYTDFKTALVPFLDPVTYGRSPTENSSFIVSSAHPDEKLHGGGYVARLSGSTAEFLNIWSIMMFGMQPFQVRDDELVLNLRPALPGWLFDQHDQVSCKFLGKCRVVYHNPSRLDTYHEEVSPHRFSLHKGRDEVIKINAEVIPPPYSHWVRCGQISKIEVFYS